MTIRGLTKLFIQTISVKLMTGSKTNPKQLTLWIIYNMKMKSNYMSIDSTSE